MSNTVLIILIGCSLLFQSCGDNEHPPKSNGRQTEGPTTTTVENTEDGQAERLPDDLLEGQKRLQNLRAEIAELERELEVQSEHLDELEADEQTARNRLLQAQVEVEAIKKERERLKDPPDIRILGEWKLIRVLNNHASDDFESGVYAHPSEWKDLKEKLKLNFPTRFKVSRSNSSGYMKLQIDDEEHEVSSSIFIFFGEFEGYRDQTQNRFYQKLVFDEDSNEVRLQLTTFFWYGVSATFEFEKVE